MSADHPGEAATFEGKVSLVTGAGSGIGAALTDELRRNGATVVATDIAGGEVSLDVSDRSAFDDVVRHVIDEHGRLDLLFNNAGISFGGETHLAAPESFDLVFDVNLRGVVNGITAAYPCMVAQGHGQIVNTASIAGLAPTPMTVAYAASKHAVVGLSTTLRPEAALHGVKVNVLCPGAVDTPILDTAPQTGLMPADAALTPREYLEVIKQKPMDVTAFARAALRGVARNRAVVIVPARGKFLWGLQRFAPRAMDAAGRRVARRVQRRLAAHDAS